MFDYKLKMAHCLNIAAMAGCLLLSGPHQPPTLSEKQAVTHAQQIPASDLDAELPARPFSDWFRQIVGPRAGLNWQLNECGEQPSLMLAQGRDLPACAEVNALLPDGRKVVVAIEVGTFKKGLALQPGRYYTAIEQHGELYPVRQLRELPEALRDPAALAKGNAIRLAPLDIPLFQPADDGRLPDNSLVAEEPPPPPPDAGAKPAPRRVPVGVLPGNAVHKVQPLYPAGAKKVNAAGKVEVLVTISEAGHVIQATATSGHPLLRRAAVEAALKWRFTPTTMKGVPVQMQSTLSFVFTPPQ
jgi:TonB family protein